MTSARQFAVYGGSFDPIHRGHLEPIEEACRNVGLESVLFVPAFSPPHKPYGPSVSAYHRFAMAALALEPYSRFTLSDFEVARAGTTYTIETLRTLHELHAGAEVLLALGSDSLLTLPSWRSWREILEGHRLLVVHRAPVDYATLSSSLPREIASRLAPEGSTLGDPAHGASIFWGGNAPVTMSSTWIRDAVAAGNDLGGSLPPAVDRYVRRQGLYSRP